MSYTLVYRYVLGIVCRFCSLAAPPIYVMYPFELLNVHQGNSKGSRKERKSETSYIKANNQIL